MEGRIQSADELPCQRQPTGLADPLGLARLGAAGDRLAASIESVVCPVPIACGSGELLLAVGGHARDVRRRLLPLRIGPIRCQPRVRSLLILQIRIGSALALAVRAGSRRGEGAGVGRGTHGGIHSRPRLDGRTVPLDMAQGPKLSRPGHDVEADERRGRKGFLPSQCRKLGRRVGE